MMKKSVRTVLAGAATLLAFLAAPWPLSAHCDRRDGPVVKAAQAALADGNVDLALVWVDEKDEAEIRQTFADAVAVRALGSAAKRLADRHFFETVVRLHRAAEGAPFTGLQPAGLDPGPAISAADRAVVSGAIDPVIALIAKDADAGIRARFARVSATKRFPPADVKAGREHVKAYVEFLHYVEGLYEAARPRTDHHH